jgi:glycosyltransferase involved in cell wall biosynthesis
MMQILSPSQPIQHSDAIRGQGAFASGNQRRVFFLLDSFEIGGTETQAVELALRLASAGYRVTMGCLLMRGPLLARLQVSEISVLEFNARGVASPSGLYQILRLAGILRGGRFEIFHAHDLWSNLIGIPAARLARVPVVISSQRDLSHQSWYTPRRRRFLRRLQTFSSVVLVNSAQIRDQLAGEDGLSPNLIRVVHNGIDCERFANRPRNREKLFPGLDGCKLIVTTGNMRSDVKGHPTLIEAAARVCARFPEARFVLIGQGVRRADFESRVRELGLQQNFFFLGSRQDVPELLACCDLAVAPSRAEGFSNAILEYMAMGLPTVATEVGGNPEIIQNRVHGLLVPKDDPAALADAISVLVNNPTFAAQLGSAGRERVRNSFGLERLARNVDALYTQLLHAGQ